MLNRNIVRSSVLAVIAAATLCSASTIARSSNQKPGQQAEASVMASSIPGIDISGKKKPGTTNSLIKATTDKDGWFSFENLPAGTYNFTFIAPQLSPALAGKVEYLVIVQLVDVGGAVSSTAKNYNDSKSNTSRIPLAKLKDGFDFTIGPQRQESSINISRSNIKNSPLSQTRQATGTATSNAPRAMNVRGRIFLVKIGTSIVIDEPGVKAYTTDTKLDNPKQ